MLSIKIESGEHWKTDENRLVQLYKLTKANALDEEPELGENMSFG